MKLLGHVNPEMTMRYVDVAGDDLQREFHLARSQPRHLAPQPKAPSFSPRAGLDGVIDSLLFAQHAIEMFRRSLPDGAPQASPRSALQSTHQNPLRNPQTQPRRITGRDWPDKPTTPEYLLVVGSPAHRTRLSVKPRSVQSLRNASTSSGLNRSSFPTLTAFNRGSLRERDRGPSPTTRPTTSPRRPGPRESTTLAASAEILAVRFVSIKSAPNNEEGFFPKNPTENNNYFSFVQQTGGKLCSEEIWFHDTFGAAQISREALGIASKSPTTLLGRRRDIFGARYLIDSCSSFRRYTCSRHAGSCGNHRRAPDGAETANRPESESPARLMQEIVRIAKDSLSDFSEKSLLD